MGLSDVILQPKNVPAVVAACCKLIDDEVSSKGGLSGLAVKAGYKAVQGVKPNFVRHVVMQLLPDFVRAVEPMWEEGVAKGNAAQHLKDNRGRAADALLSVTDEKAKNAKSGLVRGTYDKLRGSAKKHVEEAVPRLADMLAMYVK